MDHFTNRMRDCKSPAHFAAFSCVVSLYVLSIANPILGNRNSGTLSKEKLIYIMPSEMPDSRTNCSDLAAAYAVALSDIKVAHMAADVAYRAWYECEHGGRQSPVLPERSQSEIPSADFSVLVEQP